MFLLSFEYKNEFLYNAAESSTVSCCYVCGFVVLGVGLDSLNVGWCSSVECIMVYDDDIIRYISKEDSSLLNKTLNQPPRVYSACLYPSVKGHVTDCSAGSGATFHNCNLTFFCYITL